MSRVRPAISIIMPCYNTEDYVSRAVQSVLSQTAGDFELIVIDDASTDQSLKKLQEFSDPRIQTVSCPQNRGVSAVLNHGFKMVRGKYIATLASDDYWLPEKLALQIQFLEENNLDIVGTWTLEESEDFKNQTLNRFTLQKNALEFFLTNQHVGIGPSLLMRESLRHVAVDESLKVNEDWEHLARLALHGARFGVVPQALTICTRRAYGLSKMKSNAEQAVSAISRFEYLVTSKMLSRRDLGLSYLRSALWMLNPEMPRRQDACLLVFRALQQSRSLIFSESFKSVVRNFISVSVATLWQRGIRKSVPAGRPAETEGLPLC